MDLSPFIQWGAGATRYGITDPLWHESTWLVTSSLLSGEQDDPYPDTCDTDGKRCDTILCITPTIIESGKAD